MKNQILTIAASILLIGTSVEVRASFPIAQQQQQKVATTIISDTKSAEDLATGQSFEFKKESKKVVSKSVKAEPEISKTLYIILAIIGLGWLSIGILDDWKGIDWVIALALTIFTIIGGLIFSLIKMKKYY